ncbi:MAG: hypothetical protein QXV86_00200 [Candidatus Caldarchaeum sp.]
MTSEEDYACPRCGYRLSIPTKPGDSGVRRVWSLYCPRCGHSWYVKTPLEDVT